MTSRMRAFKKNISDNDNEVRLMFSFVPLLEYRQRYGCVVLGVGKLSYYPTSIINGKREFYLKTSMVSLFFNC